MHNAKHSILRSCVGSIAPLVGPSWSPQRRPFLRPSVPANRPPAAAASRGSPTDTDPLASSGLFGGEDFYTLLGVSPTCEPRDIKRAYHRLMRSVHPDTAPAPVRQAAEQLCVLLNEIYETLSDQDKRATYDTLAGFSSSSINPFLDTAFARDQIFVDEISCIGCGKCVRACPRTFEIEASKYGRARVISQAADEVEDLQIAIECCPVDCIHWVSLPQLSLLETALGKMARVEVYVMMRYGRSGGNVFEVAYRAWEARMAAIQERVAAAAAAAAGETGRVDWGFWNGGGSLKYDSEAEQRSAALDPEQRRIAGLAAAAARAARMWRLVTNMSPGKRGSRGAITDTSTASLDA